MLLLLMMVVLAVHRHGCVNVPDQTGAGPEVWLGLYGELLLLRTWTSAADLDPFHGGLLGVRQGIGRHFLVGELTLPGHRSLRLLVGLHARTLRLIALFFRPKIHPAEVDLADLPVTVPVVDRGLQGARAAAGRYY